MHELLCKYCGEIVEREAEIRGASCFPCKMKQARARALKQKKKNVTGPNKHTRLDKKQPNKN